MNSRFLSHIRVALLAILIAPACTADKGTGSSSSGSSSSGGDTSTGPELTTGGGVLTSTNGSTGSSTSGPDATTDGGSEASTGTDSSGDVSATGTTGEPEISCVDEPLYFPTFDRACVAIEDCSIVFHQVDCCGSTAAWGINGEVAKSFGEAEAVCVSQYPDCDCPTKPPIADDGKSGDPALIQVDCVEGQCKTFVP